MSSCQRLSAFARSTRLGSKPSNPARRFDSTRSKIRSSYSFAPGLKPCGPSGSCAWPWSALATRPMRFISVARASAAPAREEPERDERAPVERHHGFAQVVASVADADGRNALDLEDLEYAACERAVRFRLNLVVRELAG